MMTADELHTKLSSEVESFRNAIENMPGQTRDFLRQSLNEIEVPQSWGAKADLWQKLSSPRCSGCA